MVAPLHSLNPPRPPIQSLRPEGNNVCILSLLSCVPALQPQPWKAEAATGDFDFT